MFCQWSKTGFQRMLLLKTSENTRNAFVQKKKRRKKYADIRNKYRVCVMWRRTKNGNLQRKSPRGVTSSLVISIVQCVKCEKLRRRDIVWNWRETAACCAQRQRCGCVMLHLPCKWFTIYDLDRSSHGAKSHFYVSHFLTSKKCRVPSTEKFVLIFPH